MNIQRKVWAPTYVYLKKHKCLKCASELEVGQKSIVIRPKSEEYKKHKHRFGSNEFIGAFELIEDMFFCKKCEFKMLTEIYQRIERGTTNMEKKEYLTIGAKYLYEDGLEHAFERIWQCKKHKQKYVLGYEVLDTNNYEKTFDSLNKDSSLNDVKELRRLLFKCPECDGKVYINHMAENENIEVFKYENKLAKSLGILIPLIIFLIYALWYYFW